jgi:hypothetical protein
VVPWKTGWVTRGARRAAGGQDLRETETKVETAGCAGGQDLVNLGGLVTLGGFQELEHKRAGVTGKTVAGCLGWEAMLHIAPA